MPMPQHPLRPLSSALWSILSRAGDGGLWAPFLALGIGKALLLLALWRVDLVPPVLLAPLLALWPGAAERLRYPEVVLLLPKLWRVLEVGLFLSVDAVLQGWAIVRLGRAWTGQPLVLFPDRRRALSRLVTLMTVAAILLVVPFAALEISRFLREKESAPAVALVVGALTQMLVLTAPAFAVLQGLSLRRSLMASVTQLARLPFALPLAVLLLASLHVPGLVLQGPALKAGAARDPDWIVMALLGQIPADIVGGWLAAGLAAYFALRTRQRQPPPERGRMPRAALATTALLCLLCGAGCDLQAARDVSRRYAMERSVERATLREQELRSDASTDSSTWLGVAQLYSRAAEGIDADSVVSAAGSHGVQRDIAKLVCRALLGRAGAYSRASRVALARRDYEQLLEHGVPYRGARGDAALGLARCEDRAGRWNAAWPAYQRWVLGLQTGEWPLHASGLEVPLYVSRRLRDRNERAARTEWIERTASALDAAAGRGEVARQARYARFVVLLEAERWEEAYAALRRCRELHDPRGEDGRLVVAEASLLAGGLGREREALGLLAGLHAERSAFESQHRVAGWLLAAQIHARAGDLASAQRAYEEAANEARSMAGRSEAALGLARVHAARGDLTEARRFYAQLREVYFATPAGLLAPVEEIRLVWKERSEAEARALLPRAIQQYRGVIQQFGTEPPALLAAQYLSECFGVAGSWERGVAFLDSIAGEFDRDPRAGSLLVRAARLAVEKLDDTGRAQQLLERLYERYPDSDVAIFARGLEDSLLLAPARLDVSPHTP